VKEAQLTAAGIVIDVIEGNNLNKVFQKYSQENKIKSKRYFSDKRSGFWYSSLIWQNKICYQQIS
jgi:hypothetical protein